MSFLILVSLSVFSVQASVDGVGEKETGALVIRATVELTDGSRVVGRPGINQLRVTLNFAEVDVPLEKIQKIEMRVEQEDAILTLTNGDRLTGLLTQHDFPMDTVLGVLRIPAHAITTIHISTSTGKAMPPGEGPIQFSGYNWEGWRTGFEIRGDKLVTLPKAQEGFNYGHSGHGRGGLLATNIGNPAWKDYRVEFDYSFGPVDPSFNRMTVSIWGMEASASGGCGKAWVGSEISRSPSYDIPDIGPFVSPSRIAESTRPTRHLEPFYTSHQNPLRRTII